MRLDNLAGIIPRLSERLLPENAAQTAFNCRLSNGELVAIKDATLRYTSAKDGDLSSIFKIEDGDEEAWLGWVGRTVDVVKTPLGGSAKWAFTGDAEPRITNMAEATTGGGNDYPAYPNTLGTPQPVTKPSVSSTGGVGATVDRFYAYTFYSDWSDVELEGAVSPISDLVTGKVDDVWSISDMDATPPNSGTVTGVFAADQTTFDNTDPHWLREGEEVLIGTEILLVVAIPSPTSFKVDGDYSAETSWERWAFFAGTIYKRLYRSTGTTGQFQLVAEGITGTTYDDELTDAEIPGDELITADWIMPPVGLKCLILLPSGALAGIFGNEVCFSEPLQPHAWPLNYRIRCDYECVAIASFGSGVAVGTVGRPAIISGIEPGQMAREHWGETLPCLSQRSMISIGDMALFASHTGLIAIGSTGCFVWSQSFFTKREWAPLNPVTMWCTVVGKELYVKYTASGGQSQLLLFGLSGEPLYLTKQQFECRAFHAGESDGKLYFSLESQIFEHDSETAPTLLQDWKSKEFVLPKPMTMGAAKVIFDRGIGIPEDVLAEIEAIIAANLALMATGNVRGAFNGTWYNRITWNGSLIQKPPPMPEDLGDATFILYAGGKVRQTKTVTVSNKVFRLLSGYRSDTFAVRVISKCRIIGIEIGLSPKDLGKS